MSKPREDGGDRAKRTLDRLTRVHEIPTLPAALLRIWDLTSNSESSAPDLAQALGSDPGLTGSVLRLANSAYLGFPGKVSTVTQAVVVLGFDTVRNLATSASVFRALKRDGAGIDGDEFFRHGLETAVAARIVMTRRAPQKAGTVFCAGVLHDLGKLVLAEFLPEEWSAFERALEKGTPHEQAELDAAGLGHTEIGEWFARRWSFPDELAAAVRWHHEPSAAPEHADCVAAVHVGDVVAHRRGAGGGGRTEPPEPDPAALAALHLTEDDLEAVAATVEETMADPAPAALAPGE